jgi:hypothetical protein
MPSGARTFTFCGPGERDGNRTHYKAFEVVEGGKKTRVWLGTPVLCFSDDALPYIGAITAMWVDHADDNSMNFRTQWFYRSAELDDVLPPGDPARKVRQECGCEAGKVWPVVQSRGRGGAGRRPSPLRIGESLHATRTPAPNCAGRRG